MDSKTIGIVLIAAVAVAAIGVGAYYLMDDNKDENVTVVVQGSTTVEPIMSKVMESYKTEKSNVTIEMTANGSGTGINALINGQCDVAMSSRDLKTDESSKGLVTHTIAKDAVAVVVGKDAGVTNLTLEQVAKIYAGTHTNWSQVGGNDKAITPFVRESSSGTRETFDEKILPLSGMEKAALATKMNGYSTKGTTGEMITAVETNSGGIGYVGLGYVSDLTNGEAVNIDGKAPSKETVLNGEYKISRNLYLVTKGAAAGENKALIDWILTFKGQRIVEEEGFVPVASTLDPGKTNINIQGSTTVEPIMTKVQETYVTVKPNVEIQMTANGSGTGINALINGTCNIAMSSRDLKSSESSQGLVTKVIAKDAVAVAVGKDAGVTNLTLEQVAKIYAGTHTNWSQVGGNDKAIAPFVRESSSGTRETFDEKIQPLSGLDKAALAVKMNGYATKGTTGEMVTAVNTTPGGIGYIGLGYVSDLTNGEAVNIDGKAPSKETVLSGDYKISRNLYLVTKGEATGEIKALIDWILTFKGQRIVEEEGFVPVASTLDPGKTNIGIQGSTTVEPIMTKVQETYVTVKPNVEIQMTANGSGTGINALINGTCNIAMSSRDLKSSESSQGLVTKVIAKDAVAVVVGKDAGVTNLTLEQVAKIYAGTHTNWSQVGGNDKAIAPFVRESSSGTRETFDEKIQPLSGLDKAALAVKMNGYATKGTTGEMVTAVNTTPGGIGYIGLGYVSDLTNGKAVSIDGKAPSKETVLNGEYKISRNLYLVTKGEATGEIKALIDWVLGTSGQAIVTEEGFVALS